MAGRRREPPDRGSPQVLRVGEGPGRPVVRRSRGRDLRLPRIQWRGQDDDDADRPRRACGGCRHDRLGRRRHADAAAPDLGLSPRGARPLSPDGGSRPALVLRLTPRAAAGCRPCARARLAAAPARRGPRRPPGRGAVEGQPAEDPADRRHPPRAAGAADGRAVHRARPGQRRDAPRGAPPAPGRRPDADLLDPPDGDG